MRLCPAPLRRRGALQLDGYDAAGIKRPTFENGTCPSLRDASAHRRFVTLRPSFATPGEVNAFPTVPMIDPRSCDTDPLDGERRFRGEEIGSSPQRSASPTGTAVPVLLLTGLLSGSWRRALAGDPHPGAASRQSWPLERPGPPSATGLEAL